MICQTTDALWDTEKEPSEVSHREKWSNIPPLYRKSREFGLKM